MEFKMYTEKVIHIKKGGVFKAIHRKTILIPIPSPQDRFTSSPYPTSPTPAHGPMTFLIIQNGAENHQNLETSTIQGENWFWNSSHWSIDWLIDWVYLKCQGADKLIDWLVLSIKINKDQ